jgi:hypothetical protein
LSASVDLGHGTAAARLYGQWITSPALRGREDDSVTAWLIVFAVGLALGLLALALGWAILRNLREGQRFRARLARRLGPLRMQRLMRMLGLDPNRYLHEQRIVDVGRQMRACIECPETQRCDGALKQEKPDEVAPYCPNYETFRRVRTKPEEDS